MYPDFANLTGQAPEICVVDVGANPIDGDPPYAPLMASGRADVVGFEPNPAALATLRRRAGPRETYLPHALGDGATHTLHICAAPGMTSLFEPDPAALAMFHGFPQWGRVLATESLRTVKLDDVAETYGVELLKLDIQGAELMVLRHAQARLKTALVIQAEVEFLPLYRDQPLFTDVELFLRGHGFVFHRFFPAVSRCFAPMMLGGDIYAGLSQAVWADAIFVRGLMDTAVLTERELLASASILHDCYGSIDLALRLLLAHDARTGGVLGPAYLAGLQQGKDFFSEEKKQKTFANSDVCAA
jgi:FkbM family methyltransferase